jgi:hypothetical protein
MSYSKFKKYKDLEPFNLTIQIEAIDFKSTPITPSDWLLTTFVNNADLPKATEKAKSEFFIAPILTEIVHRNRNKVTFFSGYEFNVEKSLGLMGHCDFLISRVPKSPMIQAPVLSVVEAKDDNFEKGNPQCIAQMYASKLFNEREGKPTPVMFGASTFGVAWQFLRLEDDVVKVDTRIYSLQDLPFILGVLQSMIDFYETK